MSKNRMAGSKEFRDKIEEKKGTEWYDEASKVGELHGAHMSRDGETARYSGAEIRAEMRAGRGDMTTEELTKKYEDMYASGKINLNGNAKEYLRDKHGANLVRNDAGGGDGSADPVVDSPPETTTPDIAETPNPTSGIVDQSIDTPYQYGRYGGMTQNVNQDNDINSTVTGSNNVVNNNQDNSINGYAGDSQRFSNDYIKRFTEKFGA